MTTAVWKPQYKQKLRIFVPVLLVLLCIIPLLAVNFPPLVDLYGHLGRYAVQTELYQRPELQPYFSYEWKLIGNLGTDIVVQILHPVLGLDNSVRLVVITNQMLAASAILWISREVHGEITPFSIMALPLIYAFPFAYGFINFTLSMALALMTFAAWLCLRRLGRKGWAQILLLVMGIAVWVCHTYGWAFLGLLCGSASLAKHWRGWRFIGRTALAVLTDCAVLLLPLVPMILWRDGTQGSHTGEWSLIYKISWIASMFRTSWNALDIVCTTFLILVIYSGMRSRYAAFDPRLALAAMFSLIAFLFLPARVFNSFYADMRIFPYVLMLALLSLSTTRWPPTLNRVWIIVAVIFLALRLGMTTQDYRLKDQQIQAVVPALSSLPKGASVATFVVERCTDNWQLPILRHVGGMAIARRNVFANDQWDLPGVNLLTVTYDAPGIFRKDPSQSVKPDGCTQQSFPALSETLNQFPRPAFSHVWIVGELPASPPKVSGYTLTFNNGASLVYQRDRSPTN